MLLKNFPLLCHPIRREPYFCFSISLPSLLFICLLWCFLIFVPSWHFSLSCSPFQLCFTLRHLSLSLFLPKLSLSCLCVIIFKCLQPACLKHHQNSFGLRCFAPLHMHRVLIVIETMLNCQFASRIWLVLQDSKIISHLKRVPLFTYHSLNDLTVFFLTYLPFVLYLFFIFSILNIYLLISTSTWAFSSSLSCISVCFKSQCLLLTLLYSSFCLFLHPSYIFYLRYFLLCFSSLYIFFPHFSSLPICPPLLFFILTHLFPLFWFLFFCLSPFSSFFYIAHPLLCFSSL